MGRITDKILGTREQREHNARFNNKATDPDSPEYLASHDQVVAAEKAAEKPRRG